MTSILLLCATPDDGIDYVIAHPEIRGEQITTAWPFHFDGKDGMVAGKEFDRLIVTREFLECPRSHRMLAAARTRVRPLPVVHLTADHAELMGLGGSDE